MIRINHANGRSRAVFICDVCGQQIIDADKAVAAARIPGGIAPGSVDVIHAHKGVCHNQAETQLGGVDTGWDELSHHILQLVINSGLQPDDLVSLRSTLDEIGM